MIIPNETTKVPKMTEQPNAFTKLIGKTISKQAKFMNAQVTIQKLTVEQVLTVQDTLKANSVLQAERAKELESKQGESADVLREQMAVAESAEGLELMRTVIQMSVLESAEVSVEDFRKFPLDELSSLSGEIMDYSGMGNGPKTDSGS